MLLDNRIYAKKLCTLSDTIDFLYKGTTFEQNTQVFCSFFCPTPPFFKFLNSKRLTCVSQGFVYTSSGFNMPAYAKVKTERRMPVIFVISCIQERRVEPVVMTSSIRRTCLFSSG